MSNILGQTNTTTIYHYYNTNKKVLAQEYYLHVMKKRL